MAAPRPLRNPPITEALVDIRFAGTPPDETVLEPLRRQLAGRYPQVEARRAMQADFKVEKKELKGGPVADLGFVGLFFKSANEKLLAQFRRDGFTLNQLSSYVDAPRLFSEALDLWTRYAELVKPEAVIRLALRYINRLNLPLNDQDDLERFLLAAPNLPVGLGGGITDFISRVSSRDRERRITTIVTQKLLQPSKDDGTVPLILDLDVFTDGTLDCSAMNLQRHLEELRAVKNTAFFGSLSEETIKLYE